MEVSLLLIRQIAELFFMLLMGFIIAKIRFLSEADSKVVSKLVLYLVMPCSILNAFQESFSKEKLRQKRRCSLPWAHAAGIMRARRCSGMRRQMLVLPRVSHGSW